MKKTVAQTQMIKDCLLDFCNNATPIYEIFDRSPTIASGAIETGVAIVTSKTTGKMYTMAADGFQTDANVSASADAIEVLDASGDYNSNSKSKKKSYGKGTIGVQVLFFHLIKTRLKPDIRLKDSFSILANNDTSVQTLLGNWATRGWRKVFNYKHETQGLDPQHTAEGLAMKTEYGNSASYQQERLQLMSEVDNNYDSMRVVREQSPPFAASLRQVAAPSPAGQKQLTDGDKMDPYRYWGEKYTKSSNKMLHSISLEFFDFISETIAREGTVTLDGMIFEGIKPAIEVEFLGALPIVYEQKLSGAVVGDATPGWVLRETRESNESIFTLWKVSGHDEPKHGIVSAHNMQDWCVRESIEYVGKDDHKEISKLQARGFFQLHSDEADQDDIAGTEIASGVETGDFVVMGRQIIAKKQFWPDDEDAESMGEVACTAALPGSHATGAATAKATPPAEALTIPSVVTSTGSGLLPPKKKPKL